MLIVVYILFTYWTYYFSEDLNKNSKNLVFKFLDRIRNAEIIENFGKNILVKSWTTLNSSSILARANRDHLPKWMLRLYFHGHSESTLNRVNHFSFIELSFSKYSNFIGLSNKFFSLDGRYWERVYSSNSFVDSEIFNHSNWNCSK